MTDIATYVFDKDTPVNSLTNTPEITIRRVDTGAIVAGPSAMTDVGAEGLHRFTFAETDDIYYAFQVDADPTATGQVNKRTRYYQGAFFTPGSAGGLTAQETRDAMKLAPTAGAPAADSVDDKLDDLETQIGALNDLSQADVQSAMTAQGYTVARAGNLDNLDAAVSSRNSVVPMAAATSQSEHDATQALIAALNDLSIADVQSAMTAQGYTVARAPNLDNLDATVSSRNSVTPMAAATSQAEHDATQASIAALNDLAAQDVRDAMKLAPTAGAPAAGSVDVALDEIEADTAAMEPLVTTNLDATVSSRNSVVPMAAATSQAEHDATQAAVAALNDLSIADVQTALTNQGYTAARAPNLDNLDATVSSRNSVVPMAAATSQTEHDATQASIAALNDLAAQDVRDAMKLAPTAGAPAAGSVDEALDEIEADTAAIEPLVTTNLDATVSSRNSVVPMTAATSQAEHDATQAAVAALNDLSQADVQSAMTAQGYTVARAGNLDNLDATVSSRATQASVDIVDALVDDLKEAKIADSFLAIAGGSTTEIRTNATKADGFFDDMLVVVVNAAGVAARNITGYLLTNGAFTVDPLPFIPAASDPVIVINDYAVAGGGGGLTQQQVRDAMKLAATAGAPAADSIDDKLDGLETDIGNLNDLSQADVQTAMTAQGYTVARAGNLDNLDATVSSRNSVVPMAAATSQAEHDATQAAVAALNDLSQADVQAAMTAQGYTVARATNLDNLDVAVSTRSSHDQNDVDTLLTANHGAGSWQASGGLTQQDVRDAMKLTPAPGVPATDSIDEKLNDIETDTNATDGTVQTNLDATVSSRATPADISASETNVLNAIAALNDLSIVDVQTALTNQGYTVGRAANLDNLDTTISSRATVAAVLSAVLGSGESVDVALSRLDNIDAEVSTNIPALIAALNDLSIADVQTAMTAQGYTVVRAGNLDNLDATISSVATLVSALNDISVADILTAITASGNTVDAELSGILALRDFLEGGRDIDFTGNDALGWQRIERDTAGTLIRRYNLFDENGARINETVGSFISRAGMISAEVAI